jgi:hypothetical protein
MADGQINDISEAIGQLRAQVEIGRENDRTIIRTLGEIKGALGNLPIMQAEIDGVTARVDAIEPEVDRVRKARWFGLGVAATTGLGAGVGGPGIWQYLQKLFGNGG